MDDDLGNADELLPASGDEPQESSSAGSEVEFMRLVRDALAHLYEPAHLLRHPLARMLESGRPNLADPSQPLRGLLLDAVESLEPCAPGTRREGERESRPYQVLMRRYITGSSVQEVCQQLHISPRQFRREHHKGLQAVAAYLWARRRVGTTDAAFAAAGGLESELESLGLQLAPLAVVDLLASVRAPAQALTAGCGLRLSIVPSTSGLRCLADRTLARQAVLLALSALTETALAQGAKPGLQLACTRWQRLAGLQVTMLPPLQFNQPKTVERALANTQELITQQGGTLRLLWNGGLLHGVELLFQPEEGVRVLIVDDNDKMLRLYQRYLACGNYQVTVSASAQEAEAVLAQATPDVIVLDVMMRNVDGWELLQRLRSRPELQQVPIVVCSVLNEPKLAQFLGAQAYLKKPVVAEDFLATLQRVLDENNPPGQNPAGP